MGWWKDNAGGIIGGVISAIGSIGAGRRERKNTQMTIDANRELAKYSYAKDLEMWNMANDYNSPVNQMARFKAAGLNPNLIYGNGSAAAGNTNATMPKYNAPTVQYNYKPLVDLPGMLSQYQDFSMRQAQINNVKAQTDNVNARTINEGIESGLKQLRKGDITMATELKKFQLKKGNELLPYQSSVVRSQASQQETKVLQEFECLKLMKQENLLKLLEEDQRRKNLTSTDLEMEKKRAETLFLQYKNEWMKMGVTTSDNPLLRILTRMITESGFDLFGELKGWFREMRGQDPRSTSDPKYGLPFDYDQKYGK